MDAAAEAVRAELGLDRPLLLALAAYGSYAINAAQYIRKLRMARLQKTSPSLPTSGAQAST